MVELILGFFVMAGGLLIAYHQRQEPEHLLFISLLGWYLLGSASFNRLPLGAFIGTVMLTNRAHRGNFHSRRTAFLAGFAVFMMNLAFAEG